VATDRTTPEVLQNAAKGVRILIVANVFARGGAIPPGSANASRSSLAGLAPGLFWPASRARESQSPRSLVSTTPGLSDEKSLIVLPV
jgi:hypothetical protein